MRDDPLQFFFDQIHELLKLAESNADKPLTGPLDPSVEKSLENLEDLVKQFKEINKEELINQGINPDEIYKNLKEKQASLKESEKKLLRQGLDLGLNTVILGAALKKAKKNVGKSPQRDTSKPSKKTVQKRKGKFKGMGGDSKWQKL